MGPAPSTRWGHTMASLGTRIFVLGGEPGQDEDPNIIHVLDTGTRSSSTQSSPAMLAFSNYFVMEIM